MKTLASLSALCLAITTTTAAEYVQLAADSQSWLSAQSYVVPAGKVAIVAGCIWTGNSDLKAYLPDRMNGFFLDYGGAVLGPASVSAVSRTGSILAVLRIEDAEPVKTETVQVLIEGSDDLVSWRALTSIPVPAGTGPLAFYRVSVTR